MPAWLARQGWLGQCCSLWPGALGDTAGSLELSLPSVPHICQPDLRKLGLRGCVWETRKPELVLVIQRPGCDWAAPHPWLPQG